jgi:enoyl-CoA hydratase
MTMLTVQKQATHWSVTLNRAEKLNALCAELVEELICAVDEAAAANVPVLTLQGEGRCFSAGFDMGDVDAQSDGDLLLRFVRIETLLHRIATPPCFTVAFAHGKTFGAGVDLIAACNMRVAAPGSTFRMPGLQFGLVLGTGRFARIVGTREAQRILETSETFDVERALHNGFIERVALPEARAAVTAEVTERVAALPASSRALLYRVLNAEQADADLAALVRSAAAPGLKRRIDAYRRPGKTSDSRPVQKETT